MEDRVGMVSREAEADRIAHAEKDVDGNDGVTIGWTVADPDYIGDFQCH